jgi:serine phosphatase RsbU (regulator of sigma subunit)
MSPSEEPFGVDRLRNIVVNHCDETGEALVETVRSLVELFREDSDQQDDLTVLMVVRSPVSDSGAEGEQLES